MRAQAEKFGTRFVTDDAVKVDLKGDVKTIQDGSGNTYLAKSVILATGSGYKKIGLPKEETLSGRGVSYCATSAIVQPATSISSTTFLWFSGKDFKACTKSRDKSLTLISLVSNGNSFGNSYKG